VLRCAVNIEARLAFAADHVPSRALLENTPAWRAWQGDHEGFWPEVDA
jgi:hypothetical protein